MAFIIDRNISFIADILLVTQNRDALAPEIPGGLQGKELRLGGLRRSVGDILSFNLTEMKLFFC